MSSMDACQAAPAISMSRSRSWVSQVKPSPITFQVTRSGKPVKTFISPIVSRPLMNCTTPIR